MRPSDMGLTLRRWFGLKGMVDAVALAETMGLEVDRRPMAYIEEIKLPKSVAIADRLTPEQARWALAHAIGHHLMHRGNQVWLRRHTQLGALQERQAESFAFSLLVDMGEAQTLGLAEGWQVAEHFGVPWALVEKWRR